MTRPQGEIVDQESMTEVLAAWSRGDANGLERLLPLALSELREIAARHLRRERPDHTLQPTAVVNELYLRLAGLETVAWRNRAQFFGYAASMMRRILVDHARTRKARKRGGGELCVALPSDLAATTPSVDVERLDEALSRLAAMNGRQARVVELRFFVGLSLEEIAAALQVGTRTVNREWASARAWLYRALAGS